MVEEEKSSVLRTITRRSFIRGAAITAVSGVAAGTLSACSPRPEEEVRLSETSAAEDPSEHHMGICRGECAGGCPLDVHVRDGKVVRISKQEMPDERYNRLCVRGLQHPARIYSANRIQYPMRRTGERGAGEFERISWDDACAEIAEKWLGYIRDFGSSSILYLQGGAQNGVLGSAISIGNAGQRFQNVIGMTLLGLNVDAAAGRVGYMMGSGGTYNNQNEPADFLNSKTLISWGSNSYICSPQIVHFMKEAQEGGTRLVSIDPVYNANAAMGDLWISPLQGTDGALALGAIYEVLSNGWEDVGFLREHSEAGALIKEDGTLLRMSDLGVAPTEATDPATGQPTEVNPLAVWDESANTAVPIAEVKSMALTGITEVGGIKVTTVYDDMKERIKEWTPEHASEITGVPSDQIRELARIYREDGPVNTNMMQGFNHYRNGHYNFGPVFLLALLTGNVGKPGAACGQMVTLPVNIANIMGMQYPAVPEGGTAPGTETGATTNDMIAGSGLSVAMNRMREIVETQTYAGEPFPAKSVYITNANIASTGANLVDVDAWLKAIDFVVVADIEMTDTAKYADILLPVCHWFEYEELYGCMHTHGWLEHQEKIIEPLYESKSDWDIYRAITEAMGEEYHQFFDMEGADALALWLDTDGAREKGITLEQMRAEKFGRIWDDEVIAFSGGVFGTDTGRCKFYQETTVPDYDAGQPFDPTTERSPVYWIPPAEVNTSPDENTGNEKYPFICTHERLRTRLHSQYWTSEYNEDYEARPIVRIRPDDAADYGIEEGDEVRLFNDRGSVVLTAVISPGSRPGTIVVPRGFENFEFIDGIWGTLQSNEYNPFNANTCFQDCAVAIERVEG